MQTLLAFQLSGTDKELVGAAYCRRSSLDLIGGFPVQFCKFAGGSCVQFFLRRVFGPLLMLPPINRFDRLCLFLPKFGQRSPAILGPLICVTVSRTALASRCASASLTSDALISCLDFLAPPRMG